MLLFNEGLLFVHFILIYKYLIVIIGDLNHKIINLTILLNIEHICIVFF